MQIQPWNRLRRSQQHRQLQLCVPLVEARAEWFTSQQLSWLDRLNVELPNIRVALQFSASDSPTSSLDALEMASALRPYLSRLPEMVGTRIRGFVV